MADILDYLSNNWQSILGLGAQSQSQQQSTQPAPIPGSTGQFSPSGAMDVNPITNATNPVVGVPATAPAGAPPQQPPSSGPNTGFFNSWGDLPAANSAAAAAQPPPSGAPSLVTPANAAPAAPPQGNGAVPMPMPRPAAANGPGASPLPYPGAGGLPPPQAAPLPPGSTAVGGTPLNISPTNGSSLAQLLGAMPQRQPNPVGAGIAALGKGLSTVGGNTGAGAFARGMGGALTGGSQFQQQQQSQLFNQSSAAFRDMLAAKNQDDTEGYRRAQAAYLTSRAQAIQLGGGTGSGAYQNDPFWKTMKIEDAAQKQQNTQKQILLKQWSANGTSPEQQQSDLDALKKGTDDFRTRMYKTAGIDPKDGQKMLTYGQPDNPFPTKGMTQPEFDQKVPLSAWYTDQNGDKRQRTVPPGGWSNPNNAGAGAGATAQPSAPQSNGQQMRDYYDTSMAMQPTQ